MGAEEAGSVGSAIANCWKPPAPLTPMRAANHNSPPTLGSEVRGGRRRRRRSAGPKRSGARSGPTPARAEECPRRRVPDTAPRPDGENTLSGGGGPSRRAPLTQKQDQSPPKNSPPHTLYSPAWKQARSAKPCEKDLRTREETPSVGPGRRVWPCRGRSQTSALTAGPPVEGI